MCGGEGGGYLVYRWGLMSSPDVTLLLPDVCLCASVAHRPCIFFTVRTPHNTAAEASMPPRGKGRKGRVSPGNAVGEAATPPVPPIKKRRMPEKPYVLQIMQAELRMYYLRDYYIGLGHKRDLNEYVMKRECAEQADLKAMKCNIWGRGPMCVELCVPTSSHTAGMPACGPHAVCGLLTAIRHGQHRRQGPVRYGMPTRGTA